MPYYFSTTLTVHSGRLILRSVVYDNNSRKLQGHQSLFLVRAPSGRATCLLVALLQVHTDKLTSSDPVTRQASALGHREA